MMVFSSIAFVAAYPNILNPSDYYRRLHHTTYFHRGDLSRTDFLCRKPCITTCMKPVRLRIQNPSLPTLSRMRRHRTSPRFTRRSNEWMRRMERILSSKWTKLQNGDINNVTKYGTIALAALGAVAVVTSIIYHMYMLMAFSFLPLFFMTAVPLILMSLGLIVFCGILFSSIWLIGIPFILPSIGWIIASLGLVAILIVNAISHDKDEEDENDEDDEDDEIPNWMEWTTQFEFFDNMLRKRTGGFSSSANVHLWGFDEVSDELDAWGLGEYKSLFRNEKIDGRTLLEMNEQDIRTEFSSIMPLADRKRLLRMISDLRKKATRFV